MAGHRDTHFNVLKSVRLGDSFTVEQIDGNNAYYTVDKIRVVH
ncbi:MAG: hypothetical protein ACU84Q_01235 [Gammaproteobacteria bacterium]